MTRYIDDKRKLILDDLENVRQEVYNFTDPVPHMNGTFAKFDDFQNHIDHYKERIKDVQRQIRDEEQYVKHIDSVALAKADAHQASNEDKSYLEKEIEKVSQRLAASSETEMILKMKHQKLQEELELKEAKAKENNKIIAHKIELYRAYAGIQLRKERSGKTRLVLTKIDPSDPEREFTALFHVEEHRSSILESDPDISHLKLKGRTVVQLVNLARAAWIDDLKSSKSADGVEEKGHFSTIKNFFTR